MPKKKLSRILIKLSGESLMGNNKFGIDLNTVKRISNDLLSLKKLNIDPAIASSVFVTTITDVIGFVSFLGVGAYFL